MTLDRVPQGAGSTTTVVVRGGLPVSQTTNGVMLAHWVKLIIRLRDTDCSRQRRFPVAQIEFSELELKILVDKVTRHMHQSFEIEVDRFEAEFLISFISSELGPYYYNRGLYDAQAVLDERMEAIRAAILELEEPTEFEK